MLASAWRVLHATQAFHELATDGIYARLRHPQYLAFIVIMFGFLPQWPTLLTLVMFSDSRGRLCAPGGQEEAQMEAEFGKRYRLYAARTPAFLPTLRAPAGKKQPR